MQWKHLNYAKQGSLLREECSLVLFFLEQSDKKSRRAASRLSSALSTTMWYIQSIIWRILFEDWFPTNLDFTM